MRRKQKAKAASLRAEEDFYQPSWIAALIALALAATLIWHGAARADEFTPPESANLPDSIHGPGADRLPPGQGCSDDMDYSPQDITRTPLDTKLVSFRKAADSRCRTGKPERPVKA